MIDDDADRHDFPIGGSFDEQRHAVDLDLVPGLRHRPDAVLDQAVDRDPFVLRQLDLQDAIEIVDRDVPVDQRPIARQALDGGARSVVFILDFADDLLEDVLQRDDAGEPAELIDNDGDMDLLALELA